MSNNLDVTTISGDDVDESIKTDYERYKERLEKSNLKKLKKNVNTDILARIIENKLAASKFIKGSSGGKKEKKGTLSSIFKSCGILFLVIMLYSAYLQQKENKKRQESENLEQKRYLDYMKGLSGNPEDAFKFEPATKYKNIEYFGKEKVLDDVVSHITNITHILKNGGKEKKFISSPQKNFLLSGEPGTGKTMFVKKLAGLLDINLKTIEMSKRVPMEVLNKMTIKERKDYIEKMHSRVRIIFLTPSFINDKYIGESEKRVRELFRLASLKTKYEVTLIFFDEMDAFFGKRDSRGNENHVKSQTELLAAIGGVLDDLERLVFLFGATNRIDILDEAFDRRFANKISFEKPTYEEVFKLVSNYTIPWEKTDRKTIEEVCSLMVSKNMYQNTIVEQINDVYLYLNFTNENKWQFLLRSLQNYNQNRKKTGTTTTLKSYPDASFLPYKRMFGA
ncbi:Fidgetin-like protein 1 [Nosema granulosis]|uniref:Fidgetin-like protein 1 n=1 Tax=Nosema granulosis TaxID=83296 RepID=A0A9P6H047_9MICR|nr:Fidgetin-like protein 1 [Nosema granulosis]